MNGIKEKVTDTITMKVLPVEFGLEKTNTMIMAVAKKDENMMAGCVSFGRASVTLI